MTNDSPEYDAHRKWKKLSAPMYDWMTNHHMVWPGLACRFGGRKPGSKGQHEQTIYYSDQVGPDDKNATSNKLIKQVINMPDEAYSPMDHLNSWKENQKSPYFDKHRHVIHHPGDCNKIMDIKQAEDVVVTHSDCKDVFVWSFARQPNLLPTGNSKKNKNQRSTPDIRLTGHTDTAPFALATSLASPTVASGGEDRCVVLWNLSDFDGGSLLSSDPSGRPIPNGDPLAHRTILSGHSQTVTAVCFKPNTDNTLISTADDKTIKIWDTRENAAVTSVPQAAEKDTMTVDWSHDEYHFATGGDGGTTHVYDTRMLSPSASEPAGPTKVVHEFNQFVQPAQAVLTVSWSPRQPSWLATAGDDGRVCIYDTSRESTHTADGLPSQLVLQHIGHLGNIMDCQWSPHDDFALLSVSNDSDTYKDGGALQLWRISFLLTQPIEQVQQRLQGYQKWLETGRQQDLPKSTAAQDVEMVDA